MKYLIELEIEFPEEENESDILDKVEDDLWLLEDRVFEVSVNYIRNRETYK